MKPFIPLSVLAVLAILPSPAMAETYYCAAGYITDVNLSADWITYSGKDRARPFLAITVDQTGFWSDKWKDPAAKAKVVIGYQKDLEKEWMLISTAVQNAFANRVPMMITRAEDCDNFQGDKSKTGPMLVGGVAIQLCSNENNCKPTVPNSVAEPR